MQHEEIYAARREQIQKQRQLIGQLEAQETTAKIQLAVIERNLLIEHTRLQELEKSTTFITGMITVLNEAFDIEAEKKKQEGFELGYKARKKEEKSPKKPLPMESAARKKKLDKKGI